METIPFSFELITSKAGGFLLVYGVLGEPRRASLLGMELRIHTETVTYGVTVSIQQREWLSKQTTLIVLDSADTEMESPVQITLIDEG